FSKHIFEKEGFKQLAEEINTEKVFYYIDILSDVQTKIKTVSTPGIYLEVAAIKMINSSDDDFSYNKRIRELEQKLENLDLTTSSTPSDSQASSDRVNSIELKLNKVINELSRLELHKLSEKVESLGQGNSSSAYSKLESEIIL